MFHRARQRCLKIQAVSGIAEGAARMSHGGPGDF
jgi:hypothetical protein